MHVPRPCSDSHVEILSVYETCGEYGMVERQLPEDKECNKHREPEV